MGYGETETLELENVLDVVGKYNNENLYFKAGDLNS